MMMMVGGDDKDRCRNRRRRRVNNDDNRSPPPPSYPQSQKQPTMTARSTAPAATVRGGTGRPLTTTTMTTTPRLAASSSSSSSRPSTSDARAVFDRRNPRDKIRAVATAPSTRTDAALPMLDGRPTTMEEMRWRKVGPPSSKSTTSRAAGGDDGRKRRRLNAYDDDHDDGRPPPSHPRCIGAGGGRIRRRGYNDYYDYGAFFVVGDWRRAEELERQAFVVAGRLIPIVTVVIVVLVPWRFRQQSAAHLVGCHRRSRLFDDHELVVVERAHRQWVRSSC